jgi:hypothetical protein
VHDALDAAPVWARTGLLMMMAFAVVVGILRIVGSLAGRLVAVVGNCGSRGGPVGLRVRDRAAGSRVTDPSTDHHVIRTPDLAQLQIEMRIDVGRMKPTHPNGRQVSQLTTGRHWPRHAQRDAVPSHPGGVASSGFAITVRIGNRTGDRSICAIVRILVGRYDWSRA